MAKTIMDLFKDQKNDIYGLSSAVYIESRGLINPPRQAALLASSPNAVADLIGSAAGALLSGNANRPSDTIFNNNKPFSKPISLVPTVAQLRNAVEPNKAYFVKTQPSEGANIANFIKNAIVSPQGAQTAGLQLLNKLGSLSAKKDFQNYMSKLKGIKRGINYGPIFSKDDSGKPQNEGYFYSTHETTYEQQTNEHSIRNARNEYKRAGLQNRPDSFKNWDLVNEEVLKAGASKPDEFIYDSEVADLQKINKGLNQTYVKFRLYGRANGNIILPGTISGLSEDFAPEWNSFKYLGSPFNLYRYGGVERTLKFDIKMYYLDDVTKSAMIANLNRLRKLVFPDENINVVTYPKQPGGTNINVSQLYFVPNLVYLTIDGLYNQILGVVDTLSFSIDDITPWATTVPDLGTTETKPYPTVINVSLGMKIIEHPAIKDNKFQYGEVSEGNNQYVNYFTNNSLPLSTVARIGASVR